LDKDSANPSHPLNRFATGNKETLETEPTRRGIDVRRRLLVWHDKYYSANLMTLCIHGSQPISILQKWTEKSFQSVHNKEVKDPALQWWGIIPAYSPQSYATVTEVIF
jgi:insulysin